MSVFMSETYYFVPIGLVLTLVYTRTTNMVSQARKLQAKLDAAKTNEGKKDK